MKLGFSRQIFENYSNLKFNKNSPSGSEFHADRRRTDMTKEVFLATM